MWQAQVTAPGILAGDDLCYPAWMDDFSVIIVAGGSGSRMQSTTKKALLDIAGAPLVVHSARAFMGVAGIGEVIVALPADEMDRIAKGRANAAIADLTDPPVFVHTLKTVGVTRLVVGGRRRQDSVLNGLWACDARLQYVMVHDAARPFVTSHEITALMAKTRETGAAILAHPVRDSLKQVEGELVKGSVERGHLWGAQTPQAFRREDLMKAFQKHNAQDVTDDAAMAALAGMRCSVVPASAANFKITTPEDVEIAEALLAVRSARQGEFRPASAVFRKIPNSETIFDVQPE